MTLKKLNTLNLTDAAPAEAGTPCGEQKARRIMAGELRRRGWPNAELSTRRKGDKGKVKLARQLRAETTMTLRWIADRLRMGSWTYVSNLLHAKR